MHAALTDLYTPGNDLAKAPDVLLEYFDDVAIVRLAKAYMKRQQDVTSAGRAVVIAAGPPGAGKSGALNTMDLRGYRLIDPDDAKDMILGDAERHGLLSYRHSCVLPDGNSVSVRDWPRTYTVSPREQPIWCVNWHWQQEKTSSSTALCHGTNCPPNISTNSLCPGIRKSTW